MLMHFFARTRKHVSQRLARNRRPVKRLGGALELLEGRQLLANTPTMWGLDGSTLFSVADYTQIDQGAATAGLTIFGRLQYDQNGMGDLANLAKVIEAFDLDQNGNAYMAYNDDLTFTDGRPALSGPVLLRFNTADASTTDTNVVTIVGPISIPGFDPAAGQSVRGLSFDPFSGDLYALYKHAGPDSLLKISSVDGHVIADVGPMQRAALGLAVDAGEEIEFDEFGNLYASDAADDELYRIAPATAQIVAVVDNDQAGGLGLTNVKVEALAWDPSRDQMVAIDDDSNLYFVHTLDDGNNLPLGTLAELESPSSIDFVIPPPPKAGVDIEKFVKAEPVAISANLCTTGVKPRVLTMQYTGEGPSATQHAQDPRKVSVAGDPAFAPEVMIVATSTKDTRKILFSGTVRLGETFTIDATRAGATRLDADTVVTIKSATGSVLQTVKFHTSCSQPLMLGNQFGSLELVGFVSEAGQSFTQPPPDQGFGDDADTPTGPRVEIGKKVLFGYVVTNPGEVELANVRVTDDNATPTDNSDDFSPTFLSGDSDGDSRLDDSETWIYTAVRPALAGQQKNVSVVIGTPVDRAGNRIAPEVTDDDPAHYFGASVMTNVCATGKPRVLTMRYTGEGPSASRQTQSADKGIVTGDPLFASPVQIVASSRDGRRVYFSGAVGLGGTFDIDAARGGRTRLDADTLVRISQGGTLLQSVQFHTSCSQPLFTQNQFGSLLLEGFASER